MTTLLYRGKEYVQHKEAVKADTVELTYRRNVYIKRGQQASDQIQRLTYRGLKYQK